ncbi:DUF1514 family protein [Staphylococcus aureus]
MTTRTNYEHRSCELLQFLKNNGVEGLEDYENEVERIRKRFKS